MPLRTASSSNNLGLDAAFQVHVQLGLRHAPDECVEIGVVRDGLHSDGQFARLRDRDIGRAG